VPAPVAAPVAPAPAPSRQSEPESATGMLLLAQKLHDDYVRSGQEEGERLINEAKQQGTRIVREAEETSHRTLAQLEQERSLLERKIDELRVFERDYRTRLKSYLENLLGDLDSRGSALPPRANQAAGGAPSAL
jgi:cell division septum initiation protein DivIVA